MLLDNKKKERELEERLLKLKKENKEREENLKLEQERALATLMEENETREALMLTRLADEEEEVVKKAKQADNDISSKKLQTEEVPVPEEQPQIRECPVSCKKVSK